MKKVTRLVPKPRRGPTPRPILAMANPPNDRPMVTIDRLKGGEISWVLRMPASSIGAAITRALEEAQRLIEGCLELEALERGMRVQLAAAKETQRLKEEAGK
jgi:hypothetical protein